MADSSGVVYTSNNGIQFRVVWQVISSSGGTSQTVSFTLQAMANAYSSSSDLYATVIVNGGTYINGHYFAYPNSFGNTGWTSIDSFSITFGSGASFNLNVGGSSYYFGTNGNGAGSYTLPVLASAGTISSVTNVTIGGKVSAALTAGNNVSASSIFTDGTGTFGTDSPSIGGLSPSFTIPANWASRTGVKSFQATLNSNWKNGSTVIGSASKPFTVTIPQTSPYAITTAKWASSSYIFSKLWKGLAVQGLTEIQPPDINGFNAQNYWGLNVVMAKWGSVQTKAFSTAGTPTTPATAKFAGATIKPTVAGTYAVTATAADNRGYLVDVAGTLPIVTVYPYVIPTLTDISVVRASNGVGFKTTFTTNGTTTINGQSTDFTVYLVANGKTVAVTSGGTFDFGLNALKEYNWTLYAVDTVNADGTAKQIFTSSGTNTIIYKKPTISNLVVNYNTADPSNLDLSYLLNGTTTINTSTMNNPITIAVQMNGAVSPVTVISSQVSGLTYTVTTIGLNVNYQRSNYGKVIVSDVVSGQCATYNFSLPSQTVLMDWDKGAGDGTAGGVGIGKYHENGSLDVEGDSYFDGNMTVSKNIVGNLVGRSSSLYNNDIPVNADLNDYVSDGCYYTSAYAHFVTFANVPGAYSGGNWIGQLEVFSHGAYGTQRLMLHQTPGITHQFVRSWSGSGSTWGVWQEVYDTFSNSNPDNWNTLFTGYGGTLKYKYEIINDIWTFWLDNLQSSSATQLSLGRSGALNGKFPNGIMLPVPTWELNGNQCKLQINSNGGIFIVGYSVNTILRTQVQVKG